MHPQEQLFPQHLELLRVLNEVARSRSTPTTGVVRTHMGAGRKVALHPLRMADR